MFVIVCTIAVNCLERLVCEMMYYVSSGTLYLTYLLVDAAQFLFYTEVQCSLCFVFQRCWLELLHVLVIMCFLALLHHLRGDFHK